MRFDAAIEAAAYFVVAEALTNVVKYAHASDVRVTVMYSAGDLTVEVVDDGVGGADARHGSGLVGLMDRVGALAGRLEVVSAPGGGTRVAAMIPCAPIPPAGSSTGDDETRGGAAPQ
jgi:signal transduction histidine kinase